MPNLLDLIDPILIWRESMPAHERAAHQESAGWRQYHRIKKMIAMINACAPNGAYESRDLEIIIGRIFYAADNLRRCADVANEERDNPETLANGLTLSEGAAQNGERQLKELTQTARQMARRLQKMIAALADDIDTDDLQNLCNRSPSLDSEAPAPTVGPSPAQVGAQMTAGADLPARWSAANVRELLPDVSVRLPNGAIVPARVRGRRLDFARIICQDATGAEDKHGPIDGAAFDCNWETIADALNARRPIIA